MSDDLNRKRIELQMMSQQIGTVQSQLDAIQQQIIELNLLVESLGEIEKTAAGTEILVPLGAGIFAQANLTNPNEVLMNVGSKVAVPKSAKEAQQTVAVQIRELEKIVTHLEEEFQSTTMKAQKLQSELQSSESPEA